LILLNSVVAICLLEKPSGASHAQVNEDFRALEFLRYSKGVGWERHDASEWVSTNDINGSIKDIKNILHIIDHKIKQDGYKFFKQVMRGCE